VNNDLTFFTNEAGSSLSERFRKILNNQTQFFDILVGYFRTSGFYEIYKALENVEKIRILVGLNVDKKTTDLLSFAKISEKEYLSNSEVKDRYNEKLINEMDNSEDSFRIEDGIKKFIELIKNNKMEMRIFPESPLHAKVYILRKNQDLSEDFGKVITGSSNFSHSGLKGNLEFNVELKNSADVRFALKKFEELWEKGIDISDEYIETITKKTWLRNDITPYQLYLKFLYEFFYEEINSDKTDFTGTMLPEGFKKYQYQIDAVNQAKKILNKYDGVFLADVVGLGKTYISAMLAKELKSGRKLIICPPILVGYWEKTLSDFGVTAIVRSLGKLKNIVNDFGSDYFKYIFIDEAHKFRNDSTVNYGTLHQICLNKKVVLISATPQNNYSSDLLHLITLFQPKNNCNILDGDPDIERFFKIKLNEEQKARKVYKEILKDCNKEKENNQTFYNTSAEFEKIKELKKDLEKIIKQNSAQIRDKVLMKIMVRRVRGEIEKYYQDDIKKQGLSFPEIGIPEKIVYQFDEEIDSIFESILNLIKNLQYARYRPLSYLIEPTKEENRLMIGQGNLKGFMKSLIIKRLESSFYAFSKTIERFKISYEKFIKMYDSGKIYFGKDFNISDLEFDEEDNLIENFDLFFTQFAYDTSRFKTTFIDSLKEDLFILKELDAEIKKIKSDPKFIYFLEELETNPVFINQKKIIFTESKETAEYLQKQLSEKDNNSVFAFSGSSNEKSKEIIRANFDPNYPEEKQKDDIEILITTDVLAEGVNLHRCNILINYDLPWNPTRIMQRVGRINRIGSKFNKIHIFNFFPTSKSNNHLSLKENIINKIQSFHYTLGEDSKFLTEDEEVFSYGFSSAKLYEELNKGLQTDDESWNDSELEYLKIIREIRDEDEELFSKIKNLPRKSRSSKHNILDEESVISFIREGETKKIMLCDSNYFVKELTFFEGVKILKCKKYESTIKIKNNFFEMLSANKNHFDNLRTKNSLTISNKTVRGNDAKILKLLKALENEKKKFTGIEENKLKKFRELFDAGYLSKKIIKQINSEFVDLMKNNSNPHKILEVCYDIIPDNYKVAQKKDINQTNGKIEVILSEYLDK